MLLIDLDDRSPRPAYRQIIDGVRGKIESGVLRPGDRLPSTRRLADAHGCRLPGTLGARTHRPQAALISARARARPNGRRVRRKGTKSH